MAQVSPQARQARVVELREQGMSFREIGRALHISHEQARRLARDAGVTVLTPVPGGLAARGQAFWDHATGVFELDRHERELLTQVCRLLDVCDTLQARVEGEGVMITTARGDVKTNPATVELRQSSLALGRLLSQLEIPAADEHTVSSPDSQRARRAARSRWRREHARRGSA